MRASPSKFQAWATCPCFEYIDSGETANEGTLIHKAMETDDLSCLENEEQVELVKVMQAYRDSVRLTLDQQGAGPVNEVRELPVSLFDGIKGTLDNVMWNNTTVVVMDWKSGRLGLPAKAADSLQLKGYGLGCLRDPRFSGHKRIQLHFVAPRTNESEMAEFEVTSTLADSWENELRRILADVEDPFKQPRADDADLCRMCRHAHRCPKVTKALTPVVMETSSVARFDMLAPVAQLSPEEIGKFKVVKDLVEEWFKQRSDAINERVFQENIEIPGFKRVSRGGSLKVEDVLAAVAALKPLMSEDDIWSCASLNVTKLRKLRDDVEDLLAPYLVRGNEIKYLMRSKSLDVKKLLGS